MVLVARLPAYDYLYLGDSARAPYGARSHDAVHQFTREAVEYLFDAGCPLVVLACNTASARALRTLQQRYLPARRPDRRILGVVRPAAEALAGVPPDADPGRDAARRRHGRGRRARHDGHDASDSYRLELAKLAPSSADPAGVSALGAARRGGRAGRAGHRILPAQVSRSGAGRRAAPDRILLACTHYPLLLPAIRRVVDVPGAAARSSCSNRASIVADRLADWMARHPEMERACGRGGARRYLTTDDPAWFAARAAAMLGPTDRGRDGAPARRGLTEAHGGDRRPPQPQPMMQRNVIVTFLIAPDRIASHCGP